RHSTRRRSWTPSRGPITPSRRAGTSPSGGARGAPDGRRRGCSAPSLPPPAAAAACAAADARRRAVPPLPWRLPLRLRVGYRALTGAPVGEALLTEDGQELQLLVAFGARWGGEDEQRDGLVLVEQHLAVEFDRAELRVDEHLVVLETPRDLVPLPQVRELPARLLQGTDDLAGPRPRAHRPVGGAQVGDLGPALPVAVMLRVTQPLGRVGEPPVDLAPGQPRVAGPVTKQGGGHPVLHQRLAETGQDKRGGVVEPVEHAQQRWRYMRRDRGGRGSGVPRQLEQVIALVARQPQRAGERAEHLLAGLRAPLLLKAGGVVGR